MVRGQKRKHGDEAENDVSELTSALKELPRTALLHFRRDLSMQPYSQALHSLEVCPKIAEVLHGVQAEQVAKSLAIALGDLWCWSFDSDEVDAAQKALQTMLEDGRKKLLDALRAGESFCAVVKKYTSKKDGQPLMKLGKTRVMWLLGSGPEEGNDASQKKRPKKRRSRRKGKDQDGKVTSEASSSSEEAVANKKEKNETLNFLESIKELCAKKRKQGRSTWATPCHPIASIPLLSRSSSYSAIQSAPAGSVIFSTVARPDQEDL